MDRAVDDPPVPDERPKAASILHSAMVLLRDAGDGGLTMRKTAEGAGISLGHLQHYFPNKNALLKGLVSEHFGQCIDALREYVATETSDDPRRVASRLVAFGFEHVGDGYSDTCRVFRELWAVASRNTDVREHLEAYYSEYDAMLVKCLRPAAKSVASARRATALLLPWFEGYAITAASLSADRKAIERQLVRSLVDALEDGHR